MGGAGPVVFNLSPDNIDQAGASNAGHSYSVGETQVAPGLPFDVFTIAAYNFGSGPGNGYIEFQVIADIAAGTSSVRAAILIDGVELYGVTGGGGVGVPAQCNGDLLMGSPFATPVPTGIHQVKFRISTLNANTVGVGSYMVAFRTWRYA
jgi:hypothetical protein